MKAITIEASGGSAKVEERPEPHNRPGYLLVEPSVVGVNPADVGIIDYRMAPPGSLLGCDYAGRVVEVGEGVDRTFRVGDRVCGCTRAGDPRDANMGTFAERIVVKADLQLHLPEFMSFEDGAALGVAVLTTGRCLFDRMGIQYPTLDQTGEYVAPQNPSKQILVYGGSTCMGTMVTQFAKLAGLYVLSTSSQHNKETVESYGADFVVDRNSPTAVEELIAHAKANEDRAGPLLYCVDTISTSETALFCARVLNQDAALTLPPASSDFMEIVREAFTLTTLKRTPQEKVYSGILPMTIPLPGITTVLTLGYSFLGEPWEQLGQSFPASQEDFGNSRRFATIADSLLAAKKIRPHPTESRKGGLQGIIDTALPDLRQVKISGRKLVYPL